MPQWHLQKEKIRTMLMNLIILMMLMILIHCAPHRHQPAHAFLQAHIARPVDASDNAFYLIDKG